MTKRTIFDFLSSPFKKAEKDEKTEVKIKSQIQTTKRSKTIKNATLDSFLKKRTSLTNNVNIESDNNSITVGDFKEILAENTSFFSKNLENKEANFKNNEEFNKEKNNNCVPTISRTKPNKKKQQIVESDHESFTLKNKKENFSFESEDEASIFDSLTQNKKVTINSQNDDFKIVNHKKDKKSISESEKNNSYIQNTKRNNKKLVIESDSSESRITGCKNNNKKQIVGYGNKNLKTINCKKDKKSIIESGSDDSFIVNSKNTTHKKTMKTKRAPSPVSLFSDPSPKNPVRFRFLTPVLDKNKNPVDHPNYDPSTLFISEKDFEKLTDFEKQFWSIKKEYFDTIIFFKKGKFYELYENDAEIASSEFNLKVSERVNMKMAGVPESSFSYWASKFLENGHKIGRVDQAENMIGKKIREREESMFEDNDCTKNNNFCDFKDDGNNKINENIYKIDNKFNSLNSGIDNSRNIIHKNDNIHNANYQGCRDVIDKCKHKNENEENSRIRTKDYDINNSTLNDNFRNESFPINECNQVSTPKMKHMSTNSNIPNSTSKKKIINRELKEVITQGTIYDHEYIKSPISVYICVIKKHELKYTVLLYEASINTVLYGSFLDDTENSVLNTIFAQYKIPEVITEEKIFIHDKSIKFIKPIKGGSSVKHRSSFSNEHEYICFMYLLNYMTYLKREDSLLNTRIIQLENSMYSGNKDNLINNKTIDKYMILDSISIENLEILHNTFDGSEKHSLYNSIDHCITPFGKRKLKKWLISPLCSVNEIYKRQKMSTVLLEILNNGINNNLNKILMSGIGDIERIIGKLFGENPTLKDLNVFIDNLKKCQGCIENLSMIITQHFGPENIINGYTVSKQRHNNIENDNNDKESARKQRYKDNNIENDNNVIFIDNDKENTKKQNKDNNIEKCKNNYLFDNEKENIINNVDKDQIFEDINIEKNDKRNIIKEFSSDGVFYLRELVKKFPDINLILEDLANNYEINEKEITPLNVNDEVLVYIKKLNDVEMDLIKYLEKQKTILKDENLTFKDIGKEIFQIEMSSQKTAPENYFLVSSTKSTKRYYTKDLKDLVNEYVECEERLFQKKGTLLRRIVDSIRKYSDLYWGICEIIGELDCLLSFAFHGKIYSDSVFPIFIDEEEIKKSLNGINDNMSINNTYKEDIFCKDNIDKTKNYNGNSSNPYFIENSFNNEIVFEDIKNPIYRSYTGNNLKMQKRILILTGPNMGGKSTLLRTIGLNIILAQMGMKVAANKMIIPIFDRIFTRIGANDNLLKGESTFMVEMKEMARMLRYGTKRSLMIIDELGRGTSTKDGECIVEGVLQGLKKKESVVLFSTHYHNIINKVITKEISKGSNSCTEDKELNNNLKQQDTCEINRKYNNTLNEITNCNHDFMKGYMKVVVENEEIIFLYKLVEGICNDSYGIRVARMAGVPDQIIEKALEYKEILHKKL